MSVLLQWSVAACLGPWLAAGDAAPAPGPSARLCPRWPIGEACVADAACFCLAEACYAWEVLRHLWVAWMILLKLPTSLPTSLEGAYAPQCQLQEERSPECGTPLKFPPSLPELRSQTLTLARDLGHAPAPRVPRRLPS
mmetsp:Transcript_152844/g.490305  ORF Transcript_152844/g.490305 Transcript_152844/m.490305 type:complete len:139 (-) Transcript_152844:1160-1576(-)